MRCQPPHALRTVVLAVWITGILCAAARSQAKPTVAVLPAAFVDHHSATLRARVNPHGISTSVNFFVDGVNVGYATVGNATRDVDVMATPVRGLVAETPYQVEVWAENSAGAVKSDPLQVTTTALPAPMPAIVFQPAIPSSSYVSATVNPGGSATYLQFYVNGRLGSEAGPLSGNSPVTITKNLGSSSVGPVYCGVEERNGTIDPKLNVMLYAGGGLQALNEAARNRQIVPDYTESPTGNSPGVEIIDPWVIRETEVLLRAIVDPMGSRTYVEFYLDGVSVGSAYVGTRWTQQCYHIVSGLRPGTSYTFTAVATNSAGSNPSAAYIFRTPGTPPRPLDVSIPVLALDESGVATATIAASDPDGDVVSVQSFTQGAHGSVSITGFDVTYTAGPAFSDSDVFSVTVVDSTGLTATAQGAVVRKINHPPFANIAPLVLGVDGTASGAVEVTDPDGDTVIVQSFTQGAHGTVSVTGLDVTYTANSGFTGFDQFTVTVVDSHGATYTADATVSAFVPANLTFDLIVTYNGDAAIPAGRLALQTTNASAFSGKLTIFGADYALLGEFNAAGLAIPILDRVGLPPLTVTLRMSRVDDATPHLTAVVDAPELGGGAYTAEGEPIGDVAANAQLENRRYTVVLPMRAQEVGTPQGDGFLVGHVVRKGRAQFSGRTGDGQPFSIGGRLQRSHQLGVGARIGKSPRDYLGGNLNFNPQDGSITGSLEWVSYRSLTEHYRNDFVRHVQPIGGRFSIPRRAGRSLSQTAVIKLSGDDGAIVAQQAVVFDSRDASVPLGTVGLKIARNSGWFRGSGKSPITGTAFHFQGAIIQSRSNGFGFVQLGGPVGAVELRGD